MAGKEFIFFHYNVEVLEENLDNIDEQIMEHKNQVYSPL